MRYLPAMLYLLTMVVLPYGHMAGHSTEHSSADSPSGCCSSHASHDAEPASEPEHDDCPLCQLALLPADIPSIFFPAIYTYALPAPPEISEFIIEALSFAGHRARAPPMMMG